MVPGWIRGRCGFVTHRQEQWGIDGLVIGRIGCPQGPFPYAEGEGQPHVHSPHIIDQMHSCSVVTLDYNELVKNPYVLSLCPFALAQLLE